MRRGIFLIFLMTILALAGCRAEKYGLGIDSGAPVVKVKDIILRPADFVGRSVTLEGRIISQCQVNGCWFFLSDGTGYIFINLKPNNFALPPRMGKKARVTGIVSADQQGYQIIARGVEIK